MGSAVLQLVSNRATGDFKKTPAGMAGWTEYFKPDELARFSMLERTAEYPANTVLFREDEDSSRLIRVVSGQVKISISSSSGKRIAVAIAQAGEFLDLASVIIGQPYCVTAETIYPCVLAIAESSRFRSFLSVHPRVYKTFSHELFAQFKMFCTALRIIGVDTAAPSKMARLLLEWCEIRGSRTAGGVAIRVGLTHEQIGEFIGSSRETVTRVLAEFRERGLIVVQGATILVPSVANLAMVAPA